MTGKRSRRRLRYWTRKNRSCGQTRTAKLKYLQSLTDFLMTLNTSGLKKRWRGFQVMMIAPSLDRTWERKQLDLPHSKLSLRQCINGPEVFPSHRNLAVRHATAKRPGSALTSKFIRPPVQKQCRIKWPVFLSGAAANGSCNSIMVPSRGDLAYRNGSPLLPLMQENRKMIVHRPPLASYRHNIS